MALVDSDDDGIIDLSAIAMGASLFVYPTSSTGGDERALKSRTTVALASDANWHILFGTNEAGPSFGDHHSSLCLLRC